MLCVKCKWKNEFFLPLPYLPYVIMLIWPQKPYFKVNYLSNYDIDLNFEHRVAVLLLIDTVHFLFQWVTLFLGMAFY